MAVDYEVACREGDLAAMLTAAFLMKEGCRVLLLPPLSGRTSEPNFLLPAVRGCPARLLAEFIDLERPEAPLLSWQVGSEVQFWPGFAGDSSKSEIVDLTLNSKLWLQLDELWQLIDVCMEQNLNMPASSMVGFWEMFLLLVRSELLRESRRHTLGSWLDDAGISASEQCRWRSLVPLISLYRFAKLPILSFAYGVQTLLKPSGLVDITALKNELCKYLLAQGAQQTAEEWSPVFDGKWFVGVGKDNMVSCRSTVYLADSSPDGLRKEIPLGNQRRDFKRQQLLDDPGYLHLQKNVERKLLPHEPCSLYHLKCSESDSLSDTEFFSPGLDAGIENCGSQSLTRHRWQMVGDQPAVNRGDIWGWQPRLPAMMGAGFLPLTGSFCRFYRVGWHNLPGFGIGGLVYSARQAAFSVLKNELS
ncbi:hypothetical protein KAI46_06085 [bacterium]|nr:hypothetical protein [bacterium]